MFGFFSWMFFLLLLFCFRPFLFSLCPFFAGFLNPNALSLQHCQSGHLRTCAQQRDLPAASDRKKRKKSLGRFITFDINLIRSRWCESWTSPFSWQEFSDKTSHTAKQNKKMSDVVEASDFRGVRNFLIEMRPPQRALISGRGPRSRRQQKATQHSSH